MRRLILCALVFMVATPWWGLPLAAHADTLATPTDTLADAHIAATTSHTIRFSTPEAGTVSIQKISIQFETVSGGGVMPTGMNLTGATLGTLSANLSTGWTLSTALATSGKLSISNSSPVTVNPSPADLSIQLNGIVNQGAINICQTGTYTLTDTCYITITTYSDLVGTVVDTGNATYQVFEDPSMDFQVLPVAGGHVANGITSDYASLSASLPFGNLAPGQVHYVTQQLTISTNAPHGYTVYAYVDSPVTGEGHNTDISPFGATNATWSTPQAWMTPTGSSPGSNSGWLAANTNDTRVTGWSGSTSAKFGPISSVKHAVAHSDVPDSGTTVTVSYAFGPNIYQPSDTYTGKIHYEISATY